MSSGHGETHSASLGKYLVIFAILFVATLVEALPLFGGAR